MENLGIDVKLLLAQMLNFILFFLLVKKYIAKPFLRFIDDEKKKEKERSDAADNLQRQTAALTEEEQAFKEKTAAEVKKRLDEAKKDGKQIRADMLIATQKEVEELKAKAHLQLEQERRKMEQTMKERMVDLSMALVTRSLKDVLADENIQKKVTDKILKNVAN